jgi:hypothetical protein
MTEDVVAVNASKPASSACFISTFQLVQLTCGLPDLPHQPGQLRTHEGATIAYLQLLSDAKYSSRSQISERVKYPSLLGQQEFLLSKRRE